MQSFYNLLEKVIIMTFEELRNEGERLKISGDTNLALNTYKQALDIAKTDKEMCEIWNLILHIHTDKMLAVLIEIAELHNTKVYDLKYTNTDEHFEWVFGTNRFGPESNNPLIKDYVRPNKESLFR